ncbi:MAG TPA: TrkA C-terminal domain-containing protein [Gammaproteobacteria bacterium]|nr:TrkA C-terminal domain-containing protein [Gammaproteobacteria bacterium]
MLPILSLLLVLVLSLLVTRVATVALTYTGLSRATAQFQARSAFTGTGFTTDEAEKVVRHPVRRRIVMGLMLLGNAGIITAVSALILTFVGDGSGHPALKLAVLVAGLAGLWGLASSRWVDRYLSRLIARLLKRYTRLDTRDYAGLLHLGGEYMVSELQVEQGDWLASRPLRGLALREEGLLVLAVEQVDGTFVGVPDGDTRFAPGDNVILYGRAAALDELDDRRAGRRGQASHRRAVAEQEKGEE